jgi:hypothetical protein
MSCDNGSIQEATDHQLSVAPLRGQLLPTNRLNLYWAALTASGGSPPYRWSLTSGRLPRGLHLTKTTGVISGKPNKHDSGTYTFTVKVVDHKIKTKHHPPTQNSATEVQSITLS